MKKISGLIICKDEENNIEDCIRSILWCDEIIVIDSFSNDRTPEIVKKYTESFIQNEWKGFSEQRKFALGKVSHEFVFSLDADERCSVELEEEISSILRSDNVADGYLIPRKSYFLNKWIKHCGWYPDLQLRFFRREKVSVSDRLVHEGYKVSGETKKLKENIIHFTVNSISDYIKKIDHYSGLSAREKSDKKKISMIYLLYKPFLEFIKKFIFQLGFLDGIYGLMVSYFHMMTKLQTYMKMKEIQDKANKNNNE